MTSNASSILLNAGIFAGLRAILQLQRVTIKRKIAWAHASNASTSACERNGIELIANYRMIKVVSNNRGNAWFYKENKKMQCK